MGSPDKEAQENQAKYEAWLAGLDENQANANAVAKVLLGLSILSIVVSGVMHLVLPSGFTRGLEIPCCAGPLLLLIGSAATVWLTNNPNQT